MPDAATTVPVEILGRDLPGRRCGPGLEDQMFEDVHVGLGQGADAVELVPGDAHAARWAFELQVRRGDDDTLDFRGPFVYGARGERAVSLRWGTLEWDNTFEVFRAAKLRLSDIDPALVEQAIETGGRLVARLGLTDEHGHPVCASVRPPDVTWSVE
jgi:uncharacterized protein DUF5990